VKKSTGGSSHTVQYVEKDSKIEINQAFNKDERSEVGWNVGVKLPVLEIGCPGNMEAKLAKLEAEKREKHHAVNHSHRAIVLHGTTTKGGKLWGQLGKLEVEIEVYLERETQERPLGYMLVGGLVVVMLAAWISLYKKSGPWYEILFGTCVRFVGKSAKEAVGGIKHLLLEEISDHTFDGKQVQRKPFPYQSFGVVIMLVIAAVGMIVYFVFPLPKEKVKKWVDQADRKLNEIWDGVVNSNRRRH
jgi:hypothetical protein